MNNKEYIDSCMRFLEWNKKGLEMRIVKDFEKAIPYVFNPETESYDREAEEYLKQEAEPLHLKDLIYLLIHPILTIKSYRALTQLFSRGQHHR